MKRSSQNVTFSPKVLVSHIELTELTPVLEVFYVIEGIPSKHLSVEPLPAKCLFVELKLQKRKCSLSCS